MLMQEAIPGLVQDQLLSQLGPIRLRWLGGGGGMSGAILWKVSTEYGAFCLRRWPDESPTPTRLCEVHQCMTHAREAGCKFVPKIVTSKSKSSFVEHEDSLWELTEWLPGTADFWSYPSVARLQAAGRALARLHQAWFNVPTLGVELHPQLAHRTSPPRSVAPAVLDRLNRLEQLSDEYFDQLEHGLNHLRGASWYDDASSILNSLPLLRNPLLEELRPFSNILFPLQNVLRDIWHDHVLFQDEQVVGIVDYGAIRVDTVATDLARLLGSLLGSAPDAQWEIATDAYQSVRSLSDDEVRLLPVLYRVSSLLSGIQWIHWLGIDQLEFPTNETFIRKRFATLARSVRTMIHNLDAPRIFHGNRQAS